MMKRLNLAKQNMLRGAPTANLCNVDGTPSPKGSSEFFNNRGSNSSSRSGDAFNRDGGADSDSAENSDDGWRAEESSNHPGSPTASPSNAETPKFSSGLKVSLKHSLC